MNKVWSRRSARMWDTADRQWINRQVYLRERGEHFIWGQMYWGLEKTEPFWMNFLEKLPK